MTLPSVVVAGAPKCGTSSFFAWLTDHPALCGAATKETFYLMDADHPLARSDGGVHGGGLEGYAEFFTDCPPGARAAEATTHYYYQETARRVLASLSPQPHVVFLLRSPAERIYSSFQYSRNNLSVIRKDATFADFLAIGGPRGERLLADPRVRASLRLWSREVELSRYVEHLRPWTELFPPEKLHVYLFEELQRDPRELMRRAAADLGMDPSFYEGYGFPRRNESYSVRYPALHRFARRFARHLSGGGLRTALRERYLRTLTRPQRQRTEEDRRLLAELAEEFAPWNEALAREFPLDLSPWRPRAAAAAP